jgi:hypothetical protein
MAWFDQSIEDLLKNLTTESRTYTFKSAPASKTKIKLKFVPKTSEIVTPQDPQVAVPDKIQEKFRKEVGESYENFEQLFAYCDALNPATMINPCPLGDHYEHPIRGRRYAKNHDVIWRRSWWFRSSIS